MALSLKLLPHHLEQLLFERWTRAARVRLRRARSAPTRSAPTRSAHVAPGRKRRLYVDLAVISGHDAGTGIQRVVRGLALALPGIAPSDWQVCFVSANKENPYHRIAWPAGATADREEMVAEPGDVFVGLDYSLDAVRWQWRQLERFRRAGGTLWFLVHDLLPLTCPGWFSDNTVVRYRAWLGILAGLADGFLCNSPHTQDELTRALADRYGLTDGYRTCVLPMDSAVHVPGTGTTTRRQIDMSTPFVLMVGTLEPRKGHADVINAFTRLWRQGCAERLVLVGRLGWQIEALRDHILCHSEHGRKLFWLDDVDDEELFGLYEACCGVIVASYGEGFGLPLVEALGHGKPVLARDLPVFRPHQARGVRYFPASADARVLAGAIGEWLDAVNGRAITVTRPMENWTESASILFSAVSHAP